jgi:hypothetical protein
VILCCQRASSRIRAVSGYHGVSMPARLNAPLSNFV